MDKNTRYIFVALALVGVGASALSLYRGDGIGFSLFIGSALAFSCGVIGLLVFITGSVSLEKATGHTNHKWWVIMVVGAVVFYFITNILDRLKE